jgi:hypothetical protein
LVGSPKVTRRSKRTNPPRAARDDRYPDCIVPRRSRYRFGRTLGAGTYGVVREADGPTGKVAIKIILKKSVKGNERMVYDELDMLQRLKHPHIVQFVDWFESRVCAQRHRGWTGDADTFCIGQVLHRHAACDRWRAVRSHLRAGKIYREGRLTNHQAGAQRCRLSAQQQRRPPR